MQRQPWEHAQAAQRAYAPTPHQSTAPCSAPPPTRPSRPALRTPAGSRSRAEEGPQSEGACGPTGMCIALVWGAYSAQRAQRANPAARGHGVVGRGQGAGGSAQCRAMQATAALASACRPACRQMATGCCRVRLISHAHLHHHRRCTSNTAHQNCGALRLLPTSPPDTRATPSRTAACSSPPPQSGMQFTATIEALSTRCTAAEEHATTGQRLAAAAAAAGAEKTLSSPTQLITAANLLWLMLRPHPVRWQRASSS